MDIDYLSLYLHSPHFNESPASLIALLFLGLMRILPIVAIVPFLGARNFSRPAKVGLSIVLVAIMFPHLISITTSTLNYNAILLGYALKELFIGFAIGLLAAVPFFFAESAGILIDHQRGAASLMVNDPLLLNQDSPTGVLFNYIGVVIFFWIQGPFYFFDALITSYSTIPPTLFKVYFFCQGVTILDKYISSF